MSAKSANLKRFLFERSFDDPRKLYLPGEKRKAEIEADRKAAEIAAVKAAAEAAAIPKPVDAKQEPAAPVPMFTQAQLDAAREEGFVAGHTSALEEAETARSHYVADAMNLIAQGLTKLDEQQAETNREIGETAIRLLFAVARKTIPETAHQFAQENITDFVRKILPLVIGEAKLIIRTHDMIVEDIKTKLPEVFTRAGFLGGYTVVADYELQPGDCRLEWSGGGAERSEARIWTEIEKAMAEGVGAFDETTATNAAVVSGEAKPEQHTKTEA